MPFPFQQDFPLAPLNTFGLPAQARRYAEIQSPGQLVQLVRSGELEGERVIVLGGGSNVVLSGDLDATVLRICIRGRELIGSDDDHHFVRAGGGENWPDFVRWTLEMGWPGLENLSLIPGTVGAAPVQNIGAYGMEVYERFLLLEAVDLKSGAIISFSFDDCHFGYRDSVFKQEAAGRFVITAVTFRLPKRWTPLTRYLDVSRELAARGIIDPTPLQISDAIISIRQRKLPDQAIQGNAGSFFKNPVVSAECFDKLLARHPAIPSFRQLDGSIKLAAGWLIEEAGWKGRALGTVGVSADHALVLVNLGGATGADVLALADAVGRDVADRFGVHLEMEPILL
ncbi:MAG: UDP-N-acetylenolpyruvoylglucosamine reductase [Candidatus Dactylopiibacterium carminicum]|uniref:UDP-N-acetylenolpyruvoylglucosamine reductase n=1 Tax=Candidatus Dactylopiibacterium carminicum TaxID=857335 RepID=A0A272EUE2_9RHOO|nr:UDP-N-acetylmuramate dehydrogenase [Candidatus Dactylopiibacterium carminicum]KAF7599765.1 UDP-N-acetylmuramate dehydrogenase [Candidatus Dactylopiibacterium carminicum]PAS93719.1 MAG: UDP-N-acetylenolpyruvoylglucosamine reductase [Candidatus Dactylopiibacterium carminicum]PAS98280.1 MAG: UDP-N-acetylenolpyruvoylglucosamine reductase [Candidatus Dactylopiibacterium carminicum]PAS99766.1 MAG: UDP-N-acetylenolpyruvoylglucosamine reductase [Candidatus Dactylopiibacterium carminicum]